MKFSDEWSEIVHQTRSDRMLVSMAKSWFEANLVNRERDIIAEAISWVEENYTDETAPIIISLLLDSNQSQAAVGLAKRCLLSPLKLRKLTPLIQAVQDGPVYEELFAEVQKVLQRIPFDGEWQFALRFWQNSEYAERLVCNWINLNQTNPHMYLLRFSSGARSPAVIEACLDWFLAGGNDPYSIGHLIESARNAHPKFLPKVVDFAKNWIMQNQDSEYAGFTYGEIIRSSDSVEDFSNAKKWFESHQSNKTAWHVLKGMLCTAYRDGSPVDEFAIANSKLFLAMNKTPALAACLVRVHIDDETAEIAKELLGKDSIYPLIGMLRNFPNEESVAIAEAAFERKDDPELLLALLKLNQSSKLAQQRARTWIEQHPDSSYCEQISLLIIPE